MPKLSTVGTHRPHNVGHCTSTVLQYNHRKYTKLQHPAKRRVASDCAGFQKFKQGQAVEGLVRQRSSLFPIFKQLVFYVLCTSYITVHSAAQSISLFGKRNLFSRQSTFNMPRRPQHRRRLFDPAALLRMVPHAKGKQYDTRFRLTVAMTVVCAEKSLRAAARMHGCSPSFARRVAIIFRRVQHRTPAAVVRALRPKRRGGDRRSKLSRADIRWLGRYIAGSDRGRLAYLAELQRALHDERGVDVSVWTVGRAVRNRLQLVRKQTARLAPEGLNARNLHRRKQFVAQWFGTSVTCLASALPVDAPVHAKPTRVLHRRPGMFAVVCVQMCARVRQ